MTTEPPASRRRGLVYTFYSFKGGVGRSMALANVATLLARWGKRVLVIDWDLEAPGIEKYFAGYIPADRGRRQVPGLVELVAEVGQGRAPSWRDHLVHAAIPEGMTVDLITAGRDDPDYVSRLRAINWDDLFVTHGFGDVLEQLRNEWIAAYDFVFVDSRTGITDIGGICTIHLPDVIVTLFTANQQSLEGVKDVMQRARRGHQELPVERNRLLVLPVPARDESDREYRLAGEWRARFATELQEFFDDWAPRTHKTDDLLNFMKLPYFSYWSFGERLPVLEEDPQNPKTLAGAFAFLARLAMSRVDWDRAVQGSDAVASQLAAAEARQRDAKDLAARSPYPGLRPFSSEDASAFFGRQAEVSEILARLRAGEREIYVIGPSGSGKSSLIAAGVLPQLVRGSSGLGPFVIRALRPGEHPMKRLTQALDELTSPGASLEARLDQLGPGTSLLLVVDQLEELFTLAGRDEREQFLVELQRLRTAPRCTVLFALRVDFYGAFMESPLWAARISTVAVGPLRGEALRDAIAQPARQLGVAVDPQLVERLLADAGSEPGILPLLQETLLQLWGRRRGQTISLTDYEALGDGLRSGLAVALARRADATLRALSPAQEAIARRIFLRLVSFGEGRPDTRRQQPRASLRVVDETAADFDHVLQRLVADRLLTTHDVDASGEPFVDLCHEVLITAWPTLTGWIQMQRIDEQRRRQIEASAARWIELGRGLRGLLDPTELAEAEAWQRTDSARELGSSTAVAELVAASHRAYARQQWRRRAIFAGAFAALGVLAISVAMLAVIARSRANTAEQQQAESRRLAAEAENRARENRRLLAQSYEETGRQLVVDGRLQEAIPYLLAARQSGEAGAPLRMLFWTASRALPIVPPLAHQAQVVSAAFSPDGTRVVTASWDGTARVWDAATGKPLAGPLEHQGPVRSAAFSPDGTRVVTASEDKTARVWDAATGKPLDIPLAHEGRVVSAAFSPDGVRVVTASEDKTARVWDAATGKPLGAPLVHQGPVWSAAFSPDGTRVVTASWDLTARVWDAATGKSLGAPLVHQGVVVSAAFSPDGTRVVTASVDRTARVWDAATGKPLTRPLAHQGRVNSAAFSPDGTRVVTASNDKTAQVWDAATGKPLTSPLEHQGRVVRGAFSSDGTRVVTASEDQTARVWDAATGKPLASPLEHQGWVRSAAFSPDGTRVVTASEDQTARVWNVAAGKPLAHPLEHQGGVLRAAFSADGTRVVTASVDRTARVWDAATGKPLTNPLEHQAEVLSAAFSADGTRVVTASVDRTARVWDAATGKPLTIPLTHQGTVVSAAFSPDGTRVVTASWDQTAQVWDAVTGKPLTSPLTHQGTVVSAAFSPDGKRVVTASWDQTARVWDAATGKPVTNPLVHQGAVLRAAFSSDGMRVVTASEDHTARVWDAATGKPLTSPLEHQGGVQSAAFSSDGTRVVTASLDQTARVWDAATGKPLATPLAHQGPVWSAAFSPDGTRVVTASVDHTARVWDAATGKPLARPLEHQGAVVSAAFSPDGTRVVTASDDRTARIWSSQLDPGTLEDWSRVAERSPFVLSSGVLVLRTDVSQGSQPAQTSHSAPPEPTIDQRQRP